MLDVTGEPRSGSQGDTVLSGEMGYRPKYPALEDRDTSRPVAPVATGRGHVDPEGSALGGVPPKEARLVSLSS